MPPLFKVYYKLINFYFQAFYLLNGNNGKNKDYIYYLTSKISRRITGIFNEQKNSFN